MQKLNWLNSNLKIMKMNKRFCSLTNFKKLVKSSYIKSLELNGKDFI
jgi:hypothetical protein